jgi:hypothetical protein
LERWEPAGESLLWVRVTKLNPQRNDEKIWLYFGCSDTGNDNASALWQGYAGVWHLNEPVTNGQIVGTHVDSTANGNNGGQRGNAGVAAQLGGGQQFVPNDFIRIPNAPSLDIQGAITLSAWVSLPTVNTGYAAFVSKYNLANRRSYQLYAFDMQPRFVISQDGTNTDIFVTSDTAFVPGVWHNLLGTWDGTTNSDALSLYMDGVLVGKSAGPATATIFSSPDDAQIGCGFLNAGPAQCVEASLDEVRILPAPRSSDWVAAEDRSMRDSWITYGPTELVP